MHLRRALLLFAIVLGLAAIAASISPPPDEDDAPDGTPELREPRPAPEAPAGAREPIEVRLSSLAGPRQEVVPVGARVLLTVTVVAPGEVAIEELGLLASAEPGTPAVFDLLLLEPGRHDVGYTPVKGRARKVATLVVENARASTRSSRDRR